MLRNNRVPENLSCFLLPSFRFKKVSLLSAPSAPFTLSAPLELSTGSAEFSNYPRLKRQQALIDLQLNHWFFMHSVIQLVRLCTSYTALQGLPYLLERLSFHEDWKIVPIYTADPVISIYLRCISVFVPHKSIGFLPVGPATVKESVQIPVEASVMSKLSKSSLN